LFPKLGPAIADSEKGSEEWGAEVMEWGPEVVEWGPEAVEWDLEEVEWGPEAVEWDMVEWGPVELGARRCSWQRDNQNGIKREWAIPSKDERQRVFIWLRLQIFTTWTFEEQAKFGLRAVARIIECIATWSFSGTYIFTLDRLRDFLCLV
jgi:hypothetical protein